MRIRIYGLGHWRNRGGRGAVAARPAPPRFVVRTTIATLIMVAGVLTTVFVGVAVNVRERVRGAVADKLEAGQRMLSALEQRRTRELSVQVATLAESPTLKTAAANFKLEAMTPNPRFRRGMLAAIDRELEALAAKTASDVLAVVDGSGSVLAVGGRRETDWPVQATSAPAPRWQSARPTYRSLPACSSSLRHL